MVGVDNNIGGSSIGEGCCDDVYCHPPLAPETFRRLAAGVRVRTLICLAHERSAEGRKAEEGAWRAVRLLRTEGRQCQQSYVVIAIAFEVRRRPSARDRDE